MKNAPVLFTRFTAQYGGRHHPADALDWWSDDTAQSSRGTPAPGRSPDRTAAYRADPAARAEAVRRLDELRADREATALALAAVLGDEQVQRPGAALRRRRIAVLTACVVAGLGVAGVVLGTPSVERARSGGAATAPAVVDSRLEHAVVASAGESAPAAYFARHPAELRAPGAHRLLVSGLRLDGATAVETGTLLPARRVVLVVACASSDRSFEFTIRSRPGGRVVAHGFGACGALRPITLPLPDGIGSASVLVETRGVEPFSLSLFA